jgi:hypothetical protein
MAPGQWQLDGDIREQLKSTGVESVPFCCDV